MNSEEFVKACFEEKQSQLNLYFNSTQKTYVSSLISQLDLDERRKAVLFKILDSAITDAYYTMLLGIDGESSIGDTQIMYKLFDDENNELTGSGDIEAYAYEYFHSARS